jgi:TolB-like protein
MRYEKLEDKVKKAGNFLSSGLLLCVIFNSCVSLSDRPLSKQELETLEILGNEQVSFTSWQLFWITYKGTLKNLAYSKLLEQAKHKYGEEIDIRNIQLKGGISGYGFLVNPLIIAGSFMLGSSAGSVETALLGGAAGFVIGGNFQKIRASGDVVSNKRQAPVQQTGRRPQDTKTAEGIEEAADKASDDLVKELPRSAVIAVISIASNDKDMAAFAIDELEYRLVVSRKYKIVDRQTLNMVLKEQQFQMSGDVSDSSAVSIGQMLGANMVITGSITKSGTSSRLTVKVLDVKTAQILTMVRVTF